MKVLVLHGGDSPEREVSLQSGQAVAKGLTRTGHEVELVDIPTVAGIKDLPQLAWCDVVFPALHGADGEDGHLQALLDLLDVPYAMSGFAASSLAMDKGSTKRIMRAAGIPTADWLQVTWDNTISGTATMASKEGSTRFETDFTLEHICERCTAELGFPLVMKLNAAGSSLGLEIAETCEEVVPALQEILAVDHADQTNLLIEKFIPGRELTATILLGRRLPLLEIKPKQGFYDYRNKYSAGATDYLVPAPVHSPVYEQISADALRLFELVGCRHLARVDFRLDGDAYYCLEINTIPGMTETSLVPKAAAAVGISFDNLVEDLCRVALNGAGS